MAIHLADKPIDAVNPEGCGRVMYSHKSNADPLRCGTQYPGPAGVRRRVLCLKCDRSNKAYDMLSTMRSRADDERDDYDKERAGMVTGQVPEQVSVRSQPGDPVETVSNAQGLRQIFPTETEGVSSKRRANLNQMPTAALETESAAVAFRRRSEEQRQRAEDVDAAPKRRPEEFRRYQKPKPEVDTGSSELEKQVADSGQNPEVQAALETLIVTLRKQTGDVQQKQWAYDVEVAKLGQQMASLQADNASLQENMVALQADNASLVRKNTSLEEEVAEARELKALVAKQKAAMDSEKESLVKSVASVQSANAGLLADKTKLEKQNASLATEKGTLKEQNEALTSSKAALTKRSATLEAEKVALEERGSALAGDKASIASEKAALEQEKVALEKEKVSLESQKCALEKEKALLDKVRQLCGPQVPK